MTRAYNEDGQASDRWIAEFSTFDLAEKAYRVRGKINERPIRARRCAWVFSFFFFSFNNME